MSLSVHVLHSYAQEALAHLRAQLAPGVRLTVGQDLPTPADFEILVGGRPQREHLVASPNLHTLIIPWAGLPTETSELMRDFSHIAVHNLHHNAVPVAEMAFTLLLAAAKWVVPMDRSLRAHDWSPRYRPSPALVLEGKTALILGYGAIGQHVASLCRGMGMKVMAIRRKVTASAPAGPVEIFGQASLHRLLPQTNAFIICLPLTPATTGLVSREELGLLPRDAVLVNIGRGPIIDEAALYEALRDGRLYAAGLDVWYNYPADQAARSHTPPSIFPFHELENVVMSPHRAGGSNETDVRRMTHLARLLNGAVRGEPMPNRVDLQAGY
jgi:phosphoglycerate dehydrogenase-like enzyme